MSVIVRIAICDDTPVQLEINKCLTESYLADRDLEAEISLFKHPEELVATLENNTFDIYLLDMIMPMMNGVELGKFIRESDDKALIIFLTVDKDYALEAYSVNPLHYLLKPLSKNGFYEALDLAFSKLPEDEIIFTVKAKEGLKRIDLSSLCYVEYNNHRAIFWFKDKSFVETLTIPGKFLEYIAPILELDNFISPHESFIVNLNRVELLDKKGFEMVNGGFVPVSGRTYSEIKNKYSDFVNKR